jgi:hypothetical protein
VAADLTIRQSDTLPVFAQTILDQNGYVFDLTGCTVTFVMRAMNASTPTVSAAATILSAAAGTVQYAWGTSDTATTGIYACTFQVVNSTSGATYTYPNDGYLEVAIEENLTTTGGQTLVSLGEARDYLNSQGSDKARDAKLLRFIRSITPTIEFICGPIIPTQYEEWYDGGQPSITLRRRPSTTYGTTPIFSVQAVSEYNGPIEWPLAIIQSPDQGQLYSVEVDAHLYRIVRRTAGGGVQAFPSMPQSVHVWYTVGQTTVPANVVEGTLELIRLHFQGTQQGRPRMGSAGGMTTDDSEPGREIVGYFVPGKVRELLAPNKRAPAIC